MYKAVLGVLTTPRIIKPPPCIQGAQNLVENREKTINNTASFK